MPPLMNRYRLFLCPARAPYRPAAAAAGVDHLADTRVEVERDEALFAALGPPLEPAGSRRCRPRRLPAGVIFRWLEDDGLRERTCDARGNRLTYVVAGELSSLRDLADGGDNDWNRAVFVFLAALPPNTPVVLFWG